MIEACIFDLDGVVVDTARYHYEAWRRIAVLFDFEFTTEQNEALKGISRVDSLDQLLKIGGVIVDQKEKDRLLQLKNEWYLDYVYQMDEEEILPGVLDFLDELESEGIKTAIGSASKNAPTILDQIQLSDRFDAVVSGRDVIRSKPDPEVFLKCASYLKSSPGNTVVFEDSQKGLEAALAGEFLAVGIGNPEILNNAILVIPGFEHLDFDHFQSSLIENLSQHSHQ